MTYKKLVKLRSGLRLRFDTSHPEFRKVYETVSETERDGERVTLREAVYCYKDGHRFDNYFFFFVESSEGAEERWDVKVISKEEAIEWLKSKGINELPPCR